MGTRGLIAFCLLLIPALLSGCVQDDTVHLDTQATRLIHRQWNQSLGHDAESPFELPPHSQTSDHASTKLYQTQPPTRHPLASQLPAQADQRDPQAQASGELLQDADHKPTAMSLKPLLMYAIAHSREYRRQKEQLFIAALNLLIEQHLWGPRFFDTLSSTYNGVPERGDFNQALNLVNDFHITQRLPYGGEVSATALVNFVHLIQDAGGTEGQSASVTLNLTLPLLKGAGLIARENLIQAQRDLIYAGRTFQRFREQFLLDISTRYYDLVRRQAEIKNRQRQLKSFRWLNDRIEALATAGRQPHFEIQRAEQQVLFAQNNLINSEESYESQLDALKLLIGMPTTQALAILPVDIKMVQPKLVPPQAVRTAWNLRLDLQTLVDKTNDARRKVRNARNALLPSLGLTASLGLKTNAAKKNAGVDLTLQDSTASVGLSYDAPLDRRIEQLQLRKSIITMERAYRAQIQLRDSIALQVRRSVRRIQQARFTLALQRRNIEVASKRMRGVVLRLRSLGPRDFIEAQDDLLSAENRRDAALRDLRVNILEYLNNTGQLRVDTQGQWLAPVKLTPVNSSPKTLTPDQILQTQRQAASQAASQDQSHETPSSTP